MNDRSADSTCLSRTVTFDSVFAVALFVIIVATAVAIGGQLS